MFCPGCGTKIPDAAKFCPSCGRQVIGQTAPQAQTVKKRGGMLRKGIAALSVVALVVGVVILVQRFVPLPSISLPVSLPSISLPSPLRQLFGGNAYGTNACNEALSGTIVEDGNWYYYLYNEAADEKGSYIGTIRKVKKTGGSDQQIYTSRSRYSTSVLTCPYVVNGSIYFLESGSNGVNSTETRLMSVKEDGSEAVEIYGFGYSSIVMRIANGMVFFSRDGKSIYSMTLDGKDQTTVCEAGDSWIVVDGFVYTNKYESGRSTIRRTSVKDGSSETLYVADGYLGEVVPRDDSIYLLAYEEPNSHNYDKQIVKVDINSGERTILYRDSSKTNDENLSWYVIADSDIYIVTMTEDMPTKMYRIEDDLSTTLVYSYDGSWTGNVQRSRNVGGGDDAFLSGFMIYSDKAVFIPESDTAQELLSTDTTQPTCRSVCQVGVDGSGFKVLSTINSAGETQVEV